MYRLVSKLVIYRNIGRDSLLFELAQIYKAFESGRYDAADLTGRIYDLVHRLLDLATKYGFNDNLWHNYLAFLLVMTENPFTLVSEKVGAVDGSVNRLARNDFSVFWDLFRYDFTPIERALGIDCFTVLQHYRSVKKKEQFYNRNVSERVQALSREIAAASSVVELAGIISAFYKRYGVGMFGMNKAFRVSTRPDETLLLPIVSTSDVRLENLIGYDLQKTQLIRNTEAFLAGKPANNVLLYGDAGTGKSTSIKALLNHYYEHGLRMIEVYKHEFKYLPEIISIIKSRNYRFIIYMDDLSFEGFETEYKYLKAVIEGDLEVKPDNVLIYATSNRRHLIREMFSERDDVNGSETVSERQSLGDRFGVKIGYFVPDRQAYYDIVLGLAAEHPQLAAMDEAELLALADRWERRHGGRSGRVARQFIDDLAGRE